MLKTRVIPVLTVKNERLVKSVRFADHRNIGSYIAATRVFNARDVDELVFLDLDARRSGINKTMLKDVTKECAMPVTLGGGVKSVDDVSTMLACGADKVAINTAAIDSPDLITRTSERFGAQCVVVSIDTRCVEGSWLVHGEAGRRNTGIKVVDWALQAESLGAGEILLTSIECEGVMEGYDIALIKDVTSVVSIPVIACGGAGTVEHCVEAKKAGADAVAAASVFQYTQTTPAMIREGLRESGFPVRE